MVAADRPQGHVGHRAGSRQPLSLPVPGVLRRLIVTLLHSPRQEEDTGDFGGSWLRTCAAIQPVLSITGPLLSVVHAVSEIPREKSRCGFPFQLVNTAGSQKTV